MKYQGGKYRIARKLVAAMHALVPTPRAIVEPFAGGLNMTSAMGECWPNTLIYASDIRPEVATLWNALIRGWDPPSRITREEWARIKATPTEDPRLVAWNALAASFNGTGKGYGGETAGWATGAPGVQYNYVREARNASLRQVKRLANLDIRGAAYTDAAILPGDLVYCDPPYAGVTGYKTPFDNRAFWDWARSWPDADVFVSEYTGPCEPVLSLRTQVSIRSAGSRHATENLYYFPRRAS